MVLAPSAVAHDVVRAHTSGWLWVRQPSPKLGRTTSRYLPFSSRRTRRRCSRAITRATSPSSNRLPAANTTRGRGPADVCGSDSVPTSPGTGAGSAGAASEAAICAHPTKVPSRACRVILESVAAAFTKLMRSNVTERSASTCSQVAGNASEDQNLHSATGVEAEETKAPRSYLAAADAESPAIANEEELDAPY